VCATISHCVSISDTDGARYNFDVNQLILIIFGRNVAEKSRLQKAVYYFPSHLTNAAAEPTQYYRVRILWAISADATERLTRSLGCVHQVTHIKVTTRGMNATNARFNRIDRRVLPAWLYRSSKTVASLAIISLSDYFCVQKAWHSALLGFVCDSRHWFLPSG